MSPLDTGSVTHTLRLVDPLNERAEPVAAEFPTAGAYLRAVRERRGRGLADLASTTRIRRAYLAAIEESDYAALPSRPFAIGYVRAYANALEVDGELAAERFKLEAPDTSEPLRAPIGVKHERSGRRPLFFLVAGLVVVAVVGWNIAQRTMTVEKDSAPPAIPAAPAIDEAPPQPQGPIALGAPTPPPAEQTTPVPYVTPGLQTTPATPANGSAPAVAAVDSAPLVFAPKGAVYGAAAGGPSVVLQARKASSLIVRGATGQVYFARQLAAGESYRAPLGENLSAEVGNPADFSLYINNQLRGALLVAQTPLDKVAAEIVAHALPTP